MQHLDATEEAAATRDAHVRAVMGSSKDMTWPTPREWFDYLNLEFGFTLDPCCQHETAKCEKHYTPAEDGLAQSWKDERVFMNPPYGREIGAWMRKAYEEADTEYWYICRSCAAHGGWAKNSAGAARQWNMRHNA